MDRSGTTHSRSTAAELRPNVPGSVIPALLECPTHPVFPIARSRRPLTLRACSRPQFRGGRECADPSGQPCPATSELLTIFPMLEPVQEEGIPTHPFRQLERQDQYVSELVEILGSLDFSLLLLLLLELGSDGDVRGHGRQQDTGGQQGKDGHKVDP